MKASELISILAKHIAKEGDGDVILWASVITNSGEEDIQCELKGCYSSYGDVEIYGEEK